jgi:hypothetical protein
MLIHSGHYAQLPVPSVPCHRGRVGLERHRTVRFQGHEPASVGAATCRNHKILGVFAYYFREPLEWGALAHTAQLAIKRASLKCRDSAAAPGVVHTATMRHQERQPLLPASNDRGDFLLLGLSGDAYLRTGQNSQGGIRRATAVGLDWNGIGRCAFKVTSLSA